MSVALSPNALKVLSQRYLKKDASGQVCETPEAMWARVARTIAEQEAVSGASADQVAGLEKEFLKIMERLEFLPNSPTLMNAGRPLGQLSACFVLPVEDSMESIFETLKNTAIIHKSGGGTGFSFSRLREKDSLVQKTGGVASGPISFLKVFDAATQAVKQGGTRRGANMGILRVDHPDILEFIACKQTDKEICNFNISVAITDKFWAAMQAGEMYDLVSPLTGKTVKRLPARDVFEKIVACSYQNGEPGLIFIDRMNEGNPTPQLGAYEATNPCGEQVLLPYESCNLGSINLLKMIKVEDGRTQIDWDRLQQVVRLGVHFLDNVIDANRHPIPQIEEQTKLTRKIGLGVMGWSSLLARLGIAYDSNAGVELAGRVMSFIQTEAKIKSLELAKSKGVFPAFEQSVFAQGGEGARFRNATLTTIAPTGTISIIAGPTSSGIEPLFAISYFRNVMDNTKLVEVDPVFEEVARERGFYSEALMQSIATAGSIQHLEGIPDDVKRAFVTAHDIAPEWHVRMQAEFQRFTDNAVSKTINFPHSATIEQVKAAYEMAYELKCKGITVYRDGSRSDQVLNVAKKEEAAAETKLHPRRRPEVTTGTTSKVMTGCGNLYVTMNEDPSGGPFEVFTQMGKAGGCASSQLEAIGRLVSLAMRSGVESREIVEQLRGIRCPAPSWENGERILSCADAIARVLERRCAEKKNMRTAGAEASSSRQAVMASSGVVETDKVYSTKKNMVGVCPECGNPLHHEEGCQKCHGCGFSKC